MIITGKMTLNPLLDLKHQGDQLSRYPSVLLSRKPHRHEDLIGTAQKLIRSDPPAVESSHVQPSTTQPAAYRLTPENHHWVDINQFQAI